MGRWSPVRCIEAGSVAIDLEQVEPFGAGGDAKEPDDAGAQGVEHLCRATGGAGGGES